MKKIINITNLNTNEISSIGAGFSMSKDAVFKLTQSAIDSVRDNTPIVIDKAKMVLRTLSPVLSIAATATLFITQKVYSQKYIKLNDRVAKILSMQ